MENAQETSTPVRRTSIFGWFVSLLFGTFAGAWGFASLHAYFKGGVARWLVVMLVVTALSMLQVLILGGIDVLLLSLRSRKLPNGRKAWLGAILAPPLIGAAGWFWPFARFSSPVSFIMSILLPMVLVSVVVRLALGDRCERT